jgi:hypothetical protein
MLASFYLLWKKKTTGIKAWISGGDFWKELFRQETLAMMLSVPIVLLQGGTITEMARKMIFGSAQAGIGVEGAVSSTGFTFRWPPAIFSSHLGALSLSSPRQLMIALFELGPVILLTPWITIWAWKRLRAKEWIFGALILSAWIGFLGPLVLSYQAERDISRFTGHALLVWMLLLCLMVWDRARGWGKILQYIGVVSLILMVVGGLVTTGAELSAITQPVLGYELTGMDARIARDTWDRLPAGSQVFDSGWWRASALIGRQTRVAVGNTPTPEWLALANSPVPQRLLDSGYRYVYVDEIWWESLPGEYRTALSSDCVKIVKEYWNKEKTQFRRLLDLSECSP